jgi:BirA family biotin operon repressor/biotin-[acetyl-CoA-carboxylase] ligase
MDLNRLKNDLDGTLFGRNIIFHVSIPSTNTLAKALGSAGAPEGTLVLADEQTGGRGRLGRRWLSMARQNLLFSLIVKPKIEPERLFSLTMVFALSAVEGIEEISELSPKIKWPNDLYVAYKKLGGILTELSIHNNRVEQVVLGMGLNVNWTPPSNVLKGYGATSIRRETGTEYCREPLLCCIVKRFEYYYKELAKGAVDLPHRRWNERSMILGKMANIETSKGLLVGQAVRIDEDGALIIEDYSGKEHKILAGEVSVREVFHENPGEWKNT